MFGDQPLNRRVRAHIIFLFGLGFWVPCQGVALTACPWNGQISGNVALTDDYSVVTGGGSNGGSCFYVSSSRNPGTTPITIDCQGHSITAVEKGCSGCVDNGNALLVDNRPNVTIKNCNTQGAISFWNDGADNGVVDNVTGGPSVSMTGDADYGILKNSSLGSIDIEGRAVTIANNTIVGEGQWVMLLYRTQHAGEGHYDNCPYKGTNPNNNSVPERQNLPSPDGTSMGYTQYNDVIVGNTIINRNSLNMDLCNSSVGGSTVIYMECSGGNYIANNVLASTDVGTAIYMRDSAYQNLFEGNTFWVDSPSRGGVFSGSGGIGSGTPPIVAPQNNNYRYNIMRANAGEAIMQQASGGLNTFKYNLVMSNGGGESLLLGTSGQNDTYQNNTFYNAAAGKQNLSLGTSASASYIMRNNIFSHAGTNVSPYSGPNDISSLVADWNWYENRSAGNFFAWKKGGVASSGNLTSWKSLAGAAEGANEQGGAAGFNSPVLDFRISTPLNGADIGAFKVPDGSCTENWTCSPWSTQCVYGKQVRSCFDQNRCRTWQNKPAVERQCPISCTENWSYGAWATCGGFGGKYQMRTPIDANHCGTATSRGSIEQPATASCTETWSCGSWGSCVDGIQIRDCTDSCSVTRTDGLVTNRPPLSQACTGVCTESWSCTAWTPCSGGRHTRTCTDANSCGTVLNKPAITGTCADSGGATPTPTPVDTTPPGPPASLIAQ